MLAKQEAASAFQPGDHASTFGGNPLATAAGLAVIKTFIEDEIPRRAEEMGKYFREKLLELQTKYSPIKEIRGAGLMIGVEIEFGGQEIVQSCLNKGLLINCTAGNVLRFLPPLIIGRQEIEQSITVLDEVMAQLF